MSIDNGNANILVPSPFPLMIPFLFLKRNRKNAKVRNLLLPGT